MRSCIFSIISLDMATPYTHIGHGYHLPVQLKNETDVEKYSDTMSDQH